MSDELRDTFTQIQSGDFATARNHLKALATSNPSNVELLCLAAREAATGVTDIEVLTFLSHALERARPGMGLAACAVFLESVSNWMDQQRVSSYGAQQNKIAAAGPHEAALRLQALVASATMVCAVELSRPGTVLRSGIINTPVLKGSVLLRQRDAEAALEQFTNGLANAPEMIAALRAFAGDGARDPPNDYAAAMMESFCELGRVLALRDLGRFAEVAQALNSGIGASAELKFLLNPLRVEAQARSGDKPFPAFWRKGSVQREFAALESRASQPASTGCALPFAVVAIVGIGASVAAVINA